ncbi:ChaN family lipoprotein [Halomonas urumqiensis]|uniref:PDZ/DHR/GLGF protein n=1 Tax=Halomonas urumqiensis TaxID=1684789 RepID=A0A2N7UQU5_9GAMM|nr:ChaN family lipoprotein [Halomonas urumqiensis]PMR82799.1 PDZ/DHR/GLGF protein [Halomonas urumqiensis]PTB01882.1 PDZ domain-containing protein [Halomonas urumqiensis]GHE21986.1 hypothetical protein GCM10017767_25070 [Halomonas urumqiensis]
MPRFRRVIHRPPASLCSRGTWRARGHWLSLALALVLATGIGLPVQASDCAADPGQWQRDGQVVASDTLLAQAAQQRVVLLGERHDQLAHHRWQLHTLAALHALSPDMVIGLEMLPREAQPALDAWVAGELDEAAFLDASGWQQAWGFDPALYLPILHFARMQRIELVALNVTPALRQRLTEQGWSAVPATQRHGITPPAPASDEYRQALADVYARHPVADDDTEALERFINAQLVWDRAMASALAEASDGDNLVVALIGQGHLVHGHGVPWQLSDLGIDAHSTLLPWRAETACDAPAGIADALYLLGDERRFAPPPPQRLGVLLAPHDNGVRITGIAPGSIAVANDLREGDVIVLAAGQRIASSAEFATLVQRQPAGTLLPLEVRRDGETRSLTVRFPAASP